MTTHFTRQLAGIALLALLLPLQAAAASVPLPTSFRDTTDLLHNGKDLLLVFGTAACHYCDVIKQDIAEDPAINQRIAENFSAYYVAIDEPGEYRIEHQGQRISVPGSLLRNIYGVRGTPTLAFVDAETRKRIITIPGYVEPPILKGVVDYIADDIWQEQDSIRLYLEERGLIPEDQQ